jgi:hypothetical protein
MTHHVSTVGRCWWRGVARSAMIALFTAAVPAHAQLTPLSQDRYVAASASCFSGCSPASQTITAPDFAPFNMTATADVNGGSLIFANGSATQNTTIAATGISGTLSASRQSRNGSASGTSQCNVRFRLTQACSYTLSASNPGTPLPSTVSMTGPFGFVFNLTLFSGPATNLSGLLAAGEYNFQSRSAVSGGGGSMMVAGAQVTFNLSLTPLPAPNVVAGPIRNPATCHDYYQLSLSGWLEAEAKALELGGHLVTINDAAEQTWVYSTFAPLGTEYKWIGLNSFAQPGTTNFSWVSGETPTYTNWHNPPFAGSGDFVLWLSANTPFPGRWVQSTNSYQINIVGGIVEVVPCRCDWNHDSLVTSADFFEFLTAFFANNADLNCSGQTTSDDFFEFLTCFFTGCP